jgi:hypothetical protein
VSLELLLQREAAVTAAGNGVEPVWHLRRVEPRVEAYGVVVGNDVVGIAVDREDRREARAHVLERRDAPGHVPPVGEPSHPGHRVGLGVRALHQVRDVGDPEPVDHGRHPHLGLVSVGAARSLGVRHRTAAVEPGAGREHAGGEGQVPPGRAPGHDDARRVEAVLLRVSQHPAQRAAAVFDRTGRERHPSQPVLDVDDGEAHLEIGEQVEDHGVLVAPTQPPPWM